MAPSRFKPDQRGGPPSLQAEAELLEALRRGDGKAFEELVRTFGPRLLGLGRRILRNEEDARDCVQETFLSAHRALHQFEGRSGLGTWLHRIATNAALMRLRARKVRPEDPIDPTLPTYDEWAFREGPRRTNAFTPEELLAREETRGLVRDAMERIPESYRLVLVLRDIEGFSTAETAEMLETTPAAVKVRLHRARTALKERLVPLFEEDLR